MPMLGNLCRIWPCGSRVKSELGTRSLGRLVASSLRLAPMGSGGSVLTDSLKDASPAQVAETFGTLSAEDQKKVASALANVGEKDAPKEAAPEKKDSALSEEQRNMLKAAFEEIDTDKSGAIEASELKAAPW